MAYTALGQGTVRFVNNITGQFRSQVYGVDPNNPLVQQSGNSSAGIPAGSTVYGGPLLNGTGFTAQLWVGGSAGGPFTEVSLANGGVSLFRTGSAAGLWNEPAVTTIPTFGAGTRPFLQVRAWDNQGGTITSWSQILANETIPHGQSAPWQVISGLGGVDGQGTVFITPTLQGMASFNLIQVPEPSLIALGALGLGALLLRRRK